MALPPAAVRALSTITPHPHRGDILAAGVVPLTVAVALIDVRFGGTWGDGVLLVLVGLAAALVYGMGMLAPMEGASPRAYQTVLFLAGIALVQLFVLRLAAAFGADSGDAAPGTIVWMETVVALAALACAWRRNSAVCTLIAALAAGLVALFFVEWVFDPDSSATFRWILLALVLAYAAGLAALRDRRRRHAVQLVNAAGIATITLAATFATAALSPFDAGRAGAAWGWELVILAVALCLIAYAGVDEERGPGYIGFLCLLAFILVAAPAAAGGPSLIGWPILLLLLGLAGLAIGLRPRRPLPPEPGPAADSPAQGQPAAPHPPPDPPTLVSDDRPVA